MKYLSLFFIICISCNQLKPSRKLETDLFTFFKVRLNDIDSTIKLDSVRIIKLDTITPHTLLYRKIMSMYDKIDENEKIFDKALSNIEDTKQMLRLSAGLSSAVYNNSMDDFNKYKSQMTSIRNEDSLLMKTTDSLTEKLKTTDSTTLVYYQVRCLLQYQRKDLSISRDTGYAFLNTKKNIVRREDIFKD